MFGIGFDQLLVLLVAALFILGPDKLPGAAAWLGRSLKQVRQYATGARDQLQKELGPEFDQLRKPLEDLQSLRDLNPKRAITKHLMDLEDGFKLEDKPKPIGHPLPPEPSSKTLAPNERPPFDTDAT